jgi:hypothetical protein
MQIGTAKRARRVTIYCMRLVCDYSVCMDIFLFFIFAFARTFTYVYNK